MQQGDSPREREIEKRGTSRPYFPEITNSLRARAGAAIAGTPQTPDRDLSHTQRAIPTSATSVEVSVWSQKNKCSGAVAQSADADATRPVRSSGRGLKNTDQR